MKSLACIALFALAGCASHLEYPLQPADKIIFTTPERAQAFRTFSGNDMNHTGSVVEITAPTSLIIKR